jgi:hypothetical protein
VVEDHHRVAAGGRPGDLHGVLDGLRARVEQRALLGVAPGRQLRERRADVDVPVVRRDHEAGVGERADLVPDVAHHGVGRVADRGHRDPGAEVDQRVAVDVDEDTAAGRDDEHRQHRADAVGDVGLLAVQAGQRLGTGDLGHEAAFLGKGRAAGHGATSCSPHGLP